MCTRVAVMAIVVDKPESTGKLNSLLHDYGSFIIGRMGIPHAKKGVNVISVCLDAPLDTINQLSGKLGMIDGVSAKAVFSKV